MATAAAVASAVFAGIAIVISVRISRQQTQQTREQNQMQKRLLSLETSRERDRLRAAAVADVRAAIEKRSGNFWLVIRNDGPGAARAISTQLDGGPLLEHPLIPDGLEEVRDLGPGAEARYVLAVAMGARPILRVSLRWEDASGSRDWASQLTL